MFKRRRGEVRAEIGKDEAGLLLKLMLEYEQVLDSAADPGDPVIARLYPSASLEDQQVAREFDELVRSDLDSSKRHALSVARSSLGPTGWAGRVEEDQLNAWLTLLTDLRLSIGVRLDVTEEMMDTVPDPSDPKQWPLAVLHWLGALQDSLLQACMH